MPVTGWDYTLDNMTNGGVTDWKLSNTSAVGTKWQAGNPSQSAGNAPIGNPGVYVTATP